jgi:hypothetical protein
MIRQTDGTIKEEPLDLFYCRDCRRRTTFLECELRKFNQYKCACGGELWPVPGQKVKGDPE